MSTCEWCKQPIREGGIHQGLVDTNEHGSTYYHTDCYNYGFNLDREAIGWLPTVVPTETE